MVDTLINIFVYMPELLACANLQHGDHMVPT